MVWNFFHSTHHFWVGVLCVPRAPSLFLQWQYMLEAVDPDEDEPANSFQDELINLALSGTHDVVPNVRIMAAQVLGAVPSRLNSEKRANLRTALQDLGNQDSDKDVQYFARLSLDLCSQ